MGKMSPNLVTLCPKCLNDHPMVEISPNLVTLVQALDSIQGPASERRERSGV
jgi:hypothetical protein